MALRHKQDTLQAAERHLRQNKVQEALALLERVTEVRSADLLILNRICDQLVRHKRIDEAVGHYTKIAAEFTRAGFYPKAVAIHKKILRLHPGRVDSLVRLGELYLQQRLPGEASNYLLHAAERSLKAGDYVRAREVYEILVEAEPADPRHRARLAETRAAEGDTEQAGNELLLLADSLFSSGKPGDAERTYRRAAELLPDTVEPLLGICKSLSEQGRQDEALALLEQKAARKDAPGAITGELALHYSMSGREDDALACLESLTATEMPAETLMRLFRHNLDAGRIDAFWERMDRVFAAWAERGSAGRIEAIYARLGTLEQTGHVPALRRLCELTEQSGDKNGIVRALEELVRAYRARNMVDEAAATLERLGEIEPHSSLLSGPTAAPAPAKAGQPAPAAGDAPAEESDPSAGEAELPVDAEAPAVPLNRNDEEFVAGRLTQAEILEKYGLLDQATEQVREVTAKFPGHVAAQERHVALLRSGNRRDEQRDALVALALARRAIGDADGAAAAVAETERIGGLEGGPREMLERVGLLQTIAKTEEAGAEAVSDVREAPPAAEPDAPAPEPAVIKTAPAAASYSEEEEEEYEEEEEGSAAASGLSAAEEARAVVIDFDDTEDDAKEEEAEPRAEPLAPPQPKPGPRVRVPGEDMLDEIRLQLSGGMPAEARRRIQTLRLLGYASEAMDRLDEEIGEALATAAVRAAPVPAVAAEPGAAEPQAATAQAEEEAEPAAEPEPTEQPVATAREAEPIAAAPAAESAPPVEEPEVFAERAAGEPGDDDDLSTITAALEGELFADDGEAVVPEAQSEQSLEDVFSAFKRHVAEEVGSEDFRTHYDLGIAYKEMGLIDEAIGEFLVSVASPEMSREASIMLAICHRDRRETDQAAEWYRRALDAPGGDPESVAGLRYDLAEVLLEAGDVEHALKAFRDVLEADPAFRDVRERVEQLESRSTP